MKKTYIIPSMETAKIDTMPVLTGSDTTFKLSSTEASTSNGSYSNALAPEQSGGDGEEW